VIASLIFRLSIVADSRTLISEDLQSTAVLGRPEKHKMPQPNIHCSKAGSALSVLLSPTSDKVLAPPRLHPKPFLQLLISYGPDPANTAEYNEAVKLFAKGFAAGVPKLELSLIEIMSLLLVNKQSPRQAVNNLEIWMGKMKEEKKKVKRADSGVFSG